MVETAEQLVNRDLVAHGTLSRAFRHMSAGAARGLRGSIPMSAEIVLGGG